jgi:hypothetical protein
MIEENPDKKCEELTKIPSSTFDSTVTRTCFTKKMLQSRIAQNLALSRCYHSTTSLSINLIMGGRILKRFLIASNFGEI